MHILLVRFLVVVVFLIVNTKKHVIIFRQPSLKTLYLEYVQTIQILELCMHLLISVAKIKIWNKFITLINKEMDNDCVDSWLVNYNLCFVNRKKWSH